MPTNPSGCEESYTEMTGPSNKPLSENLAEQRAQQLAEVHDMTQRLLTEHESAFRQQLNDVQRTTGNAIREVETRQTKQLQTLEKHLENATRQARRLNRTGGIRSWMRTLATTVAVMIGITAATAGGLQLTDRLINSRLERLATLNQEIEQAENLPRLPEGIEIRTLGDGFTYLTGIDPDTAWTSTLQDGKTPVIRLTEDKED